MILRQRQKTSPNVKVGFRHEVFKLCCKHNCLDVWLKLRQHKENPLNTIKRRVVSYYLAKDHIRCRNSLSMFYSLLLLPNTDPRKVYRISPLFNHLGLFRDTIDRRHFIFALLDNCSYNRVCPICEGLHMDVIQHTLDNCSKAAHLRLLLKYKLIFYNVPKNVNIANKHQLFQLAIYGKQVFKKVICEFITEIGIC